MGSIVQDPQLEWGGSWTIKKLDAFEKYVKAYMQIMKKQKHWQKIYFDGFAGSGVNQSGRDEELLKIFEFSDEEQSVYKGSAERVVRLPEELRFDFYYFIDADKQSVESLEERLRSLDSAINTRLIFRHGDCNTQLQELAKAMDKNPRLAALVFLDPFGMQINWDSIAGLKGKRVDIWILLPTAVIINRLLERDIMRNNGELQHRDRLVSFFGLSEEVIIEFFYRQEQENDLFGTREIIKKVERPIEKIAELYIRNLKSIWKFVTEKPLILKTDNNRPLFHLIFASNNETGLKIAKQIIEG